jgi:chromosome segregation ATPase
VGGVGSFNKLKGDDMADETELQDQVEELELELEETRKENDTLQDQVDGYDNNMTEIKDMAKEIDEDASFARIIEIRDEIIALAEKDV